MDSENLKKWAPLGAAGIFGVAAAGIGYTLVSQPAGMGGQTNERPAIAFEEIVVATRPLRAGSVLTQGDLTLARVARDSRPQTAFSDPSLLTNDDSGPRVVAQLIAEGQPIMQEHLAPEGTAGGVAAFLPEGYRAMSISVEPDTGLQGLLKPDAHVDIVATLRGEGPPVVRTIVQNVRVLAVNGQLAGQGEQSADGSEKLREESATLKQVTLMVTPEQAGRVELAISHGSPRLVLRARSDQELTSFEGLTLAALRGTADESNAQEPVPAEPFDPVKTADAPPTTATEPVSDLALIDLRPIDAPLTGPGSLLPATRPATPPTDGPTTRPTEPKEHVIEVIRGGTVSRKIFREDADADDSWTTDRPDPFE